VNKEFVYIGDFSRKISQLLTKRTPIISQEKAVSQKEKYIILYNALKEKRFDSEETLARELFATSSQSAEYRTLRSQLKKKLLNSLFHLDLKRANYAESSQIEYANAKHTFMIKILSWLGMRALAIPLAKQTLESASNYEHTINEVELLTRLREHASLTGQKKEYTEYSNRLALALKNMHAEIEAKGYREKLYLVIAQSAASTPSLLRSAKQFATDLEILHRAHPRFVVGLERYRVQAIAYQLDDRYDEAITVCKEAENFLKSYSQCTREEHFGEFALKRLVCSVQSQDFQSGFEATIDCIKYYKTDSPNWFVFKEYHILLCMHAQRFQEAKEVLEDVKSKPRFAILPDPRKEKWALMEYYLKFVLGELMPTKEKHSQTQKLIDRIVREMPINSKDKTGHNVALLILQILLLLSIHDYESIVKRIEALRVYMYRYLNTPGNRQSALFFKLLLLLEKESFNATEAAIKAAPMVEQLRLTHSDIPALEGFQILPYEWLWNKILEMCSTPVSAKA